MHQLLLATRNVHKTREFAQMLGTVCVVTDLRGRRDLPEVEESGRTFEENATLKAMTISRLVEGLVVGDDSGLEVDALGGAPGVYSARYAGEHASDSDNVAKLLADLASAGVDCEPTAQFRCVLAVAAGGALLHLFSGAVGGMIARAPAGSQGFGYDPIFRPHGSSNTFAQMGDEAKNAISHRAAAIRQLRAYIETSSF